MKITGYSERGAVNALFYEIAYSSAPLRRLEGFLALAHFGGGLQIAEGLSGAQVFIEQSLSDFGDADAILLLDVGERRTLVFLEAKVKSSSAEDWTLDREFGQFMEGCRTDRKLNSSNLFTQLYHKTRLVEGLVSSGGVTALKNGLDFPACSTKGRRKIGQNPIVLKVVNEIAGYATDVWYLALVPDTTKNVRAFFEDLAKGPWPLPKAPNLARWGGLAWENVLGFCDSANLPNTRRILEFNGEQICSQKAAQRTAAADR